MNPGVTRKMLAAAASLVLGLALASCEPSGGTGLYVFTFNPAEPLNSQLKFVQSVNGSVYEYPWRAGSGTGITDPCVVGHGPTPPGYYGVNYHDDHQNGGPDVSGRAWHIGNTTRNGVWGAYCVAGNVDSQWREQLMIHTEESPSGTQSCPGTYENWCWSGPGEYASYGCVKVSPTDMNAVDHTWHEHGGAAAWAGNRNNVSLIVPSY